MKRNLTLCLNGEISFCFLTFQFIWQRPKPVEGNFTEHKQYTIQNENKDMHEQAIHQKLISKDIIFLMNS